MMKKVIFTIAFLCSIISVSLAQEKGDQFIGFNFGTSKSKADYQNQSNESKNIGFGIQYSKFIQQNRSLNFSVSYVNLKNENNFGTNISSSSTNQYSFGMSYGILFPLLKKFYAQVSPGLSYSFSKNNSTTSNPNTIYHDNSYTAYLSGGILWVPFNHFGLSMNLASMGFGYARQKQEIVTTAGSITQTSTSSSFNISNQGSLQYQSFTIFYKFK